MSESLSKALIKVGYACNNDCIFCHTVGSLPARDTAARVAMKIDRAAELGYDMVVLSGGEPTTRPELLDWAARVAERGLALGLVTNARMLSNRGLVDRLVERNLRFVHFSVHGGCADTHDAMVRAPAFAQTVGAIESLTDRGLDLTAACVVTRANIHGLRDVVDLLRPYHDVCSKLAFTEPKGAAATSFDAIVPPISDVAAAVVDAIRYGLGQRTGRCFAHEGIPLCLVPGLEELGTGLETYGFAAMSEAFEDDFFPVDTHNRAQTARCVPCELAESCAGLYKGYVERRGDAELEPVRTRAAGTRIVDDAKIREHEAAAHEEHTWVRLTRCCNNRCAFCLDSAAHDGSFVSVADARREILEGRNRGSTRLILSGGEPTMHPEFVDLVRFGNQLSFRKVQTITNGRRFSYPRFLRSCLDAGLGEITFSIHGHDAEVHDRLVGVPGAFDQAVSGLTAALADGRPVVNVDVCLNRANIDNLPALLDRFIALGVREFDLLHLVPFGRAYGDDGLFYDIAEAMPSIEYALELSERPNLHIWFNRFPAPYLERYEHLIQDPKKLHDEVRGRAAEMERWATHGVVPSCREPRRCSLCYLNGLCDDLDETIDRAATGRSTWVRARAEAGALRLPPLAGEPQGSWLLAPDVGVAAAVVPRLPGTALILELGDYSRLFDHLRGGALGGRELVRAYTRQPSDLDRLLADGGTFEVVAVLTREMADHLRAAHGGGHSRLALAAPTFDRLTEARSKAADLSAFFAAWTPSCPVEGVPPCVSGRMPRLQPDAIDMDLLRDDGLIALPGFTERHILTRYTSKSLRCRDCAADTTCDGLHINTIRAFGYGILRPLDAARAAALDSAPTIYR